MHGLGMRKLLCLGITSGWKVDPIGIRLGWVTGLDPPGATAFH